MKRECCCCWSKDIFAECEDAEEMLKLSDLIGDTFIIRYLCKKDFDYTNRELEERGYKERLIENNGKWRVK
jgi:hypothetical protein